ncbi:Transcription elongation factor spt6 [Arthrobotrys musiformis]|uniref:Transcription elongation factor Spt6 n=1 Tax=Arthrobotrys musiformis TaxID=47236 RepID=A0AAV9WEH3_9PEZI
MSGYFDREAEDESQDESMGEEAGDSRKKQRSSKKQKKSRGDNMDMDSSEEENTEDEEEGLAEVGKGFIVSDDDEEEEESQSEPENRSRRKRKRRRSAREEEEDDEMDEEDLDLIAENMGEERPRGNKLKRFKRGKAEERPRNDDRDLVDISSDEGAGEFIEDLGDEDDGFIEDDDMSEDDVDERNRAKDRAREQKRAAATGKGLLNAESIEKMEEIFGDGHEYDWAIVTAEELEEEKRDQVMNLEDVFEPSELKERMLTDEDNEIRSIDIPERFQLARKPYAHIMITDDEYQEEGNWIASQMFAQKRNLQPHHRQPFFRAVNRVLDFIVKDNMEIPFIYQNRKDYIIHNEGRSGGDRLLGQDELWMIMELDLKYRAFIDKKNAVKRTYQSLSIQDETYTDRIGDLENVEEIQDLQEYLQFRYSEELKDIAAIQSQANGMNGAHKKRPGATRTIFDKIRKSRVYNLVKAFGISAAEFAHNVSLDQKRNFPDEPAEFPNELADACLDSRDFKTSSEALKAAKAMLAEEFFMNPILRRAVRQKLFINGQLHVKTTDKGLKKIDELHPYYEFKYLRNQSTGALLSHPARFLKMLAAESEGLVTLQIEMSTKTRYLRQLYDLISSENYSDQADAWNEERKDVVDMAMEKLLNLMAKNYKENIKTVCEDELAKQVRKNYVERLDQAHFQVNPAEPNIFPPRVLALTAGQGADLRDGVLGVFMDQYGKVLETLKMNGVRDTEEVKKFVKLINDRNPAVIALGGFTVATYTLESALRKIIEEEDIRLDDEDHGQRNLLDIIFVQDEVARLYMNSERAASDFPSQSSLGRYCAALARYVQNPLLEYAACGENVLSISFHPDQQLLPKEKLQSNLESAMVDMVNLTGVNINEVVNNQYYANLLPYLCGLGPRKAGHMLKMIGQNGGSVQSRSSMVGDPDNNIKPLMGPCVWTNCASFTIIEYAYELKAADSEYLDSTRVHPQDYELGRKMAADALELDEEDVNERTNNGDDPGAVIRLMISKEEQYKVNELILEEYADELERNFNQRKRATLETIRAELQEPYEELRNPFRRLSSEEIFTKLTGETADSLVPGMIVPVNIRRVTDRFLVTKLDCGITGNVASEEMSDKFGVSPHSLFHVSQTVQAKIKTINIRSFYAELTFKESELRIPYRKSYEREPDEWDEDQEEKDRVALTVKQEEQHRAARVIKHPLFRAFNSRQAEEYLAQHSRGDVVIRPSSKGQDHIAITWKVGDGLYQHIDVLELDKENEFSIGRTLKVGGKYTYSDLDDLIFNHVKPMAKKVGEIERHDKFKKTREEAEAWLTNYAEAFPGRTVYVFHPDPKRPGHFDLCFKTGQNKPPNSWKVTVVPQAFSLANNLYGDVNALCNGFKILFTNQQQQYQGRMEQQMRQQRYGGPPPPMRR